MKGLKFVSGFVLGALVFGSAGVYAATEGKMIEAFYNIKDIKINKVSKMPEVDKPFIYNGSTYVPLRFIAESLGQPVDWDPESQTVLIGETIKPTDVYPGNGLDSMNYQSGGYNSSYADFHQTIKFNGTKVNDNIGNEYANYILLFQEYGGWSYTDFPLNGQYKKFSAKLAIQDTYKSFKGSAKITIIADGKEISNYEIKSGDFPKDLELDIANINKITIRMDTTENYKVEIGLFDAHFTK